MKGTDRRAGVARNAGHSRILESRPIHEISEILTSNESTRSSTVLFQTGSAINTMARSWGSVQERFLSAEGHAWLQRQPKCTPRARRKISKVREGNVAGIRSNTVKAIRTLGGFAALIER